MHVNTYSLSLSFLTILGTCAQYQSASEMSQIDQPMMGNMMQNRRVRRRATAGRMQALWGNGAEDYKLRREEQLGAMRQEVCVCACVYVMPCVRECT